MCSSRLKEKIYRRGPESSEILCILFVGLPIPHFISYEIIDLEFRKEEFGIKFNDISYFSAQMATSIPQIPYLKLENIVVMGKFR